MAGPPLPRGDALPSRIGRYYVLSCIDRGAMGIVYRARDEVMGRDVAVKLLAADLEDEPDIRARFLREAEATARLSHPNIITIFDVGEDDGRFFIVMELLRGATLKEYLKQLPPATLDRKLDLMIQMCAGLGAAHQAGVFHRDIKPGNLFVRTDGMLKILDFGIARLANSNMTRVGFIVGTPEYMSPEQARGEPIDLRSDIFSAGSVFYFMLTGRSPFAAPDLPTIFRHVERDDPRPLTDEEAPPALTRTLGKAMAKHKDARHQSCHELMEELIEIREQESVLPTSDTDMSQLRAPSPAPPEQVRDAIPPAETTASSSGDATPARRLGSLFRRMVRRFRRREPARVPGARARGG